MDPITVGAIKEVAIEATKKAAEKSAEMALDYTADRIDEAMRPDKESNALRTCEKITNAIVAGTLSDAAIETRVEAAAHSACLFFGIPDAELMEGDAIGVYRNCDIFVGNDVFEYNLGQFKDMGCVSFEDMTKVWAHECGHRILRIDFQEPWAQELGADFFSGVRSEMLGLPCSNFEEMLASTKASPSHPDGIIRVMAIEYGREVVRQFQAQGITPTIENCKAAFANSPFAQVSYENFQGDGKLAAFVDDKVWHEKNAKTAQENANYYTKEAAKAVERGDFSHAKDLEQKAQSYQSKANDEMKTASSCTKLVDVETTEISSSIEIRRIGGSYDSLDWGWKDTPPHEKHHMPSNASSHLETGDGPCIAMEYEDHVQTASWGNSRDARAYAAVQKELIEQGKFREAMQMDIDDIHTKFGDKYDAAIAQMLEYVDELERNNKI